jgi:hypothetical protein
VSVPETAPHTVPEETVAEVLLAVQVPPATDVLSSTESSTQTCDGPDKDAAKGGTPMVTTNVAAVVPQVLVTEYLMVYVPA